jgi:hypothetical protein
MAKKPTSNDLNDDEDDDIESTSEDIPDVDDLLQSIESRSRAIRRDGMTARQRLEYYMEQKRAEQDLRDVFDESDE